MSHLVHIRRLRHPLISVFVALLLFIMLIPLRNSTTPVVAPPTPPMPVQWPTAMPAPATTMPVSPITSTEPRTLPADKFAVYLPQLNHSVLAAATATQNATTTPEQQVTVMRSPEKPLCLEYLDIRITWYELGSCCNKAPDHPAYGITRSGLPVQWGMAAVQAETPLVPLGTTVVIKDLGPIYPMVVTDTGSETAFGSGWLDVYAPSEAVGYWLEQQIGRDGRSDVLVCPTVR